MQRFALPVVARRRPAGRVHDARGRNALSRSGRPRGAWPERGVGILNGIVGDYLDRRGLRLSIAMTFVQEGRPLALNARSLAAAQPAATGRIAILVHGWCCTEDVWSFADDASTYASRLQRDAGYTPFAVRYNTGLPIAESGRDFARLMRALAAAYPVPIEEIVLIGHSMGGLVVRSACHTIDAEDAAWTARVRHAFYLGTPHEGADVERFAQGATAALRTIPNPLTRLIGSVLNLRGGRDLRSGAHAPDSPSADPSVLATLRWLPSARHWLLMGTLTDDPRHPVSRVLGDGLVRVPPPADRGTEARDAQAIAGVMVFPGLHHLQLARDPAVYDTLRRICGATAGAPDVPEAQKAG